MKKVLCENLADDLKENIKEGTWKVGERLPGELELVHIYGVGRSTVREALHILQEQKMIQKRNGVGTFVIAASSRIDNPLLRLDSVGKMITAAGYQPKSVRYKVFHTTADDEMAQMLKLENGEAVVVINRGRTADGQAVAFSYNIMPEKYVKDAFDSGLEESIFETMKKCGMRMEYALTEICGMDMQKKWDAAATEFLAGPVVLLKQLHYETEGRPVLYSYDYLNTEVVKLGIRRDMI